MSKNTDAETLLAIALSLPEGEENNLLHRIAAQLDSDAKRYADSEKLQGGAGESAFDNTAQSSYRQRQHTPAPWRYEIATKTIRAEPANYWLATMDSWEGAVNHEANAKLIAAAPEMAEAIAFALLDSPGLSDMSCDKLRAALTKAGL